MSEIITGQWVTSMVKIRGTLTLLESCRPLHKAYVQVQHKLVAPIRHKANESNRKVGRSWVSRTVNKCCSTGR